MNPPAGKVGQADTTSTANVEEKPDIGPGVDNMVLVTLQNESITQLLTILQAERECDSQEIWQLRQYIQNKSQSVLTAYLPSL
ncbi:hypothetical protein CYMTET_52221 [Cymbomonas tetramitiformis]|uniref:Uncharacterized protein n=1 Tax=Cymbomonas tetramitiformis TaxID=36881 RepID=A0AAE0ERK4_9CHLO|nr:hypothetical protein CYMTET_52221 [Cymbomonas tetramitiformis]